MFWLLVSVLSFDLKSPYFLQTFDGSLLDDPYSLPELDELESLPDDELLLEEEDGDSAAALPFVFCFCYPGL